MTINCTLDDFRFPGLPTYPNQFGTKKVSGQGLSTAECCDDMAMPFNRQRPYIITETSETTELHANSVFKITAADITLTIADAVYDGCTALIVNNSTGTVTVKGGVSGLDGSTAGMTSGNSGATASTAPAFTGKAGTTGETGAGSAVNIMPPYEVANCWRRTA